MTKFQTTALSAGRKAVSALAIAAVVGVALSPASAFAKGKGGHGHHGGHYGYGVGALAGGLILGAIVAGAAEADDAPACWTEKRARFDAYGDAYIQRVRVCD